MIYFQREIIFAGDKGMENEKKHSATKNIGGAGDGIYYESKSKTWGYRVIRNGKDFRRRGFDTKKSAKEARINFLAEYNKTSMSKNPDADTNVKLKVVYDHYMKFGSIEKKYGTLRKQQSLWRIHIGPAFGDRTMVSIGVGELKNYLIQLYHNGSPYNNFKKGYAYEYVEGFLKLFYLLWGYARRMFWISRDTYSTMCEDKKMRLEMPKKTNEDLYDNKIEIYTRDEIQRIAKRLESTNLYTAFLLGYYLGVRKSECFGLMWSDLHWEAHTIKIERQLLTDSHNLVLSGCKTPTAIRTIEIPDKLYDYLIQLKVHQEENKKRYGRTYQDKEVVRVRTKNNQDDKLRHGDFINRHENGKLLTGESLKPWIAIIEREIGIHFKYHNLRHTHATILAACNTPIPKLKHRLGHTNILLTTLQPFISNSI